MPWCILADSEVLRILKEAMIVRSDGFKTLYKRDYWMPVRGCVRWDESMWLSKVPLSMTQEGALRHLYLRKIWSHENKIRKSPSLFVAFKSFVGNTLESLLSFILSLQMRLRNNLHHQPIRLTYTIKLLTANSDNDQAPDQASAVQSWYMDLGSCSSFTSLRCHPKIQVSAAEWLCYLLGRETLWGGRIFKYHWVVTVKVAT